MTKKYLVLREGYDPMPDTHKYHRNVTCEELAEKYGLSDDVKLLFFWRKKTKLSELPPLSECVVLGPRMEWSYPYALPDNYKELLRNRLNWHMRKALDNAWKTIKQQEVAHA